MQSPEDHRHHSDGENSWTRNEKLFVTAPVVLLVQASKAAITRSEQEWDIRFDTTSGVGPRGNSVLSIRSEVDGCVIPNHPAAHIGYV